MNTQPVTRYNFNLTGKLRSQTYEFIVEPTRETPFIKYSEDEKTLMIKGYSMKPDMHHFYNQFTSTVWNHLDNHQDFKLYFFFRDLNASTAKVLFDIFKKARMKIQGGGQVEIVWCASSTNEEMLQTGKDFAEIYGLNFKYAEVSD